MKVKKLADGTIQFQKDERDYEDVVTPFSLKQIYCFLV